MGRPPCIIRTSFLKNNMRPLSRALWTIHYLVQKSLTVALPFVPSNSAIPSTNLSSGIGPPEKRNQSVFPSNRIQTGWFVSIVIPNFKSRGQGVEHVAIICLAGAATGVAGVVGAGAGE